MTAPFSCKFLKAVSCLSICPFVPFVSLCVYLSVWLSDCLPVCPCIFLSVSVFLSICFYICPLSLYLVCVSFCLFVTREVACFGQPLTFALLCPLVLGECHCGRNVQVGVDRLFRHTVGYNCCSNSSKVMERFFLKMMHIFPLIVAFAIWILLLFQFIFPMFAPHQWSRQNFSS